MVQGSCGGFGELGKTKNCSVCWDTFGLNRMMPR
ncbi:(Na+)-NQR maturation NqrM [Planktothrix agardhii]